MSATLRQTPLHDAHVGLGARMVPFAGWEMPVQYEGVIPEHMAVRTRAGAFDVSHMGQLHVDGPAAQPFLQSVLSNDVDRVQDGGAQYTLLTTESGGIVDDLIVYRLSHGCYLLVVNAGNRQTAYEWLKEREPRGVEVRDASDEYGLVAVQGPASLELIGLDEAPAFTHAMGEVAGVETMICRTGYTGETGVELMCPAEDVVPLWNAVLERGVVPCGLGARDTLRLEVCYPLHGNDITQDTNAIEAGLGWVCASDKQFTGSDVLERTRAEGPVRRLVALRMDEERAVPRPACPILDDAGGVVGEVTSGTFSPTLERGIGLGYAPAPLAQPDTPVAVDIRGRIRPAHTARKPLYVKR